MKTVQVRISKGDLRSSNDAHFLTLCRQRRLALLLKERTFWGEHNS